MFPLGVSSGSNHWVSTGLDAAVTNLQHLRWMFSICCFCLDFSQSLHTICFELWAHSGANGSCANEMEFVWSHDLIDAVLCLVSTKWPLFSLLFVLFQPPQMLWKPLVLTRCNKSALSCDLWPAGPLRCVQNCRLIAERVLTDDCNASVAICRRSVMHLVALTAADCWSVMQPLASNAAGL